MQTLTTKESRIHRRGFASMSLPRRRQIAGMGGKAAVRRHKWTSEEARAAGRIGGAISRRGKTKASNS